MFMSAKHSYINELKGLIYRGSVQYTSHRLTPYLKLSRMSEYTVWVLMWKMWKPPDVGKYH